MKTNKITYPTFPRVSSRERNQLSHAKKIVSKEVDSFHRKDEPKEPKWIYVPEGLSTFATLNYPI